jgi:methionyl-tRNA formyltransferase
MKIVYMGTPEFAVPALESLIKSGNKPILVVSQPDARRDRGEKIKPTPVKAMATEWSIPVEQPEKIRGNVGFLEMLKGLEPDLIVVAAYGKILPTEILTIPKKGCINIHGSLLPKYRGAAPIQRAILAGETETGVTLMQMDEGMDTGDILACASTQTDGKTTGILLEELAVLGADLLLKNLPLIELSQLTPMPQENLKATYAPMIYKSDGLVDFTKPAIEIERQVRAMNPWPTAYTTYNGQLMKIWQAEVAEQTDYLLPGTITEVSQRGIIVATGLGSLIITEIQMPGKKKMPVSAYIRGNQIEINRVLG